MKHLLKGYWLQFILALMTLASLALVIEAGQRWK
jgi:hypothetical protein